MLPLLLLPIALSAEPNFRFDFKNNLISGDFYPGPLLQALATRGDALDACLVGVETQFDRLGRVPSLDIFVSAGGDVQELGFNGAPFLDVNACLRKAITGLALPKGSGDRMGIISVVRTEAAAAGPLTERKGEADGIAFTLTARAEPQGSGVAAVAHVVATPTARAQAIGAEALTVVAAVYRPDGSSTQTGSWSIGDQNPAPCVGKGTSHVIEDSTSSSDTVHRGEVMRANVVLTHGPCGDAMATRTVIGALELTFPMTGDAAVTVWAPSDLDATPKPFEKARATGD